MPKPPFRRGIDPLIEAGLFEKPSDPFGSFLWFCEGIYIQNHALQQALKEAGIDPAAVLRRYPVRPGSPGFHRKVFDKWYRQIAQDQLRRFSYLAKKANPKSRDN
jgi:hypothetical protein